MKGVIIMTKYREILRLASLGFSNRSIALSVPCSRNTVAKVLKMAQELKLCWPLQDNQTDEVLEKLFYPQLNNRPQKREPDYDYIRKELLRNGVSKKAPVDRIHGGLPCQRRRTTHVFTVLLSHPTG